jgi:AraC-like DNA-binding protein
VQELAAVGCTDEEIARIAGVSEGTIKRHFDPQLKQGRGSLREKLRKAQVARALQGSDTMLIWLGKQYLDQHDKQEIRGHAEKPLTLTVFDHAAAAAAAAGRSGSHRLTSGTDEGDRDGETVG